MKVFGVNYDGRSRRIVAAKTKKEAAQRLGVSLHQFRNYGCQTGNQEEIELAMREPGVVWSIGFALNSNWVRVTL